MTIRVAWASWSFVNWYCHCIAANFACDLEHPLFAQFAPYLESDVDTTILMTVVVEIPRERGKSFWHYSLWGSIWKLKRAVRFDPHPWVQHECFRLVENLSLDNSTMHAWVLLHPSDRSTKDLVEPARNFKVRQNVTRIIPSWDLLASRKSVDDLCEASYYRAGNAQVDYVWKKERDIQKFNLCGSCSKGHTYSAWTIISNCSLLHSQLSRVLHSRTAQTVELRKDSYAVMFVRLVLGLYPRSAKWGSDQIPPTRIKISSTFLNGYISLSLSPSWIC